jgi:leucyl aminopeptidase
MVLVRKGQDLAALVQEAEIRDYVEKHFSEGDRESALLNLPGRMLAYVRLDDEKVSKYARLEKARIAAHSLHSSIVDRGLERLLVINAGVSPEESIAFTEGLALSNYQFLKYRTGDNRKENALKEIALSDEGLTNQQVLNLENLVSAVYRTRDLVNEPLSYLSAEQLSAEMEQMGREAGFSVEVFGKLKIESLKMGGLLAVNRGSVDPPTFSILSYKPDKAVNPHPIVLVGKGVVYDTGGLSLKPTLDSMDYMKCDMGGAAAVAGTFYVVARNELPVWIIGLVPATDNRPDGNAYVPGDVVTMYDGTSVEVMNTDAEGRMILADALSYARQYDPEVVIELSTLTGSAHAAVDRYGIVGMGNAGREIMEQLKESGDYTAERIAEFPFWEEYKEALKSEVADLKNIGGKYAGAITAGKFLEHFTDYPFIHLDIAGPAFNKTSFNYRGKGGSGVGVRILFNFLLNRTL